MYARGTGRICERYISTNLECVSRQPQRIWRPIDCNTLRTRQSVTGRQQTGGVSTHYGVPSINASPDHGSAATESTSILVTEIDDRLWPSPTPDSSAIDAADSNVDGQGNRDNRASDLALSDINTNMTSHASYPMSTFDSNPLLDLDDLQANSFPRDTGARAFESRQTWTTNDTTCPSRKAFQVPPRALPMPYFSQSCGKKKKKEKFRGVVQRERDTN